MPVWAAPAGEAINETCPVGVPPAEATCTAKPAFAPCAIVPLGEALMVVVEAVKPTPPQAAARLAMLTVPRPLAKSYPEAAVQAGTPALANTPYWLAAVLVLLQFGEPPWQATEILPVTTS